MPFIQRRLLPDKFNDNACFRADRLGLFIRAALTAAMFSGVRMAFFRKSFFFNAEHVSSKLVTYILIALADGTESWRLKLK